MKIVGLFNDAGFNPLKDWDYSGLLDLRVVYQDEYGKTYVKYLDSGDIYLLLLKYERITDIKEREEELKCCLNSCKSKNSFGHVYRPIKNKYYYHEIDIKNKRNSSDSYIDLSEFPKNTVRLEPNYCTSLNVHNTALLFPNKELYVGKRDYIYTEANQNFSIENKEVIEIEDIIGWLVENMFLDEATELIYKIKASNQNLDKYKFAKNVIAPNGVDNFLDSQLNRIESIKYVRDNTKILGLHYFKR